MSDWESPQRLWSLLDMLKRYGALFYELGRVISLGRRDAVDDLGKYGPNTSLPEQMCTEGAQAMRDMLNRDIAERGTQKTPFSVLTSVADQMERFAQAYEKGMTFGDFDYHTRALEDRFRDELDRHWLFWVDQDKAELYRANDHFGPWVTSRFPDAIDDIEEAAKCLALDRATACVMHLVRVMEVGLKAIAEPLGIPYAPSWESYLKQITTKIGLPYDKKDPQWRGQEPFFRDVSGDLVAIKQAWRNPSMHVVRKYSPDEAGEVYVAVRRFMQRLATGLPL
jgi:hypothetical protein